MSQLFTTFDEKSIASGKTLQFVTIEFCLILVIKVHDCCAIVKSIVKKVEILLHNSVSVYNLLLAIIHLYMIKAIVYRKKYQN